VGVELLDAQQQCGGGDAERGGEASQAAIAGVQAPGLDRGEIGLGDAARESAERGEAEVPLLAQLADSAAENVQVVLVGGGVGQENLPNWVKTTVCNQVFPIAALFPAAGMREAAFQMPRPRTSKPRDPELATLSAAIEAVMARRSHTTQTAVAERAGLEVKQVNRYVRGQIEPSIRNFRRLARGLGVEASELMAEIEAIEVAEAAHQPALEGVASGVR
jgi:Helix-turn-helix